MDDHENTSLDRRSFLKAAATGGAALVGSQALGAQQAERPATAASAQADASTVVEIVNDERPGSDFMMDVLKPLGFEYITINPTPIPAGCRNPSSITPVTRARN